MNGAGGLVRSGTGTLTLSNATNSYTGGTTITAGTLVANADGSLDLHFQNTSPGAASVTLTLQGGATNNYIADTATLNIGFTNDTVNLAYSGTDTIKALVINGVTQANGTWGSPTSGAMHTDPLFTGPGILNVNPLTVSTAVSRKNHGGTDFDLALPLFPSPAGVESRLGGLTNDYTISLTSTIQLQ
jgi:autotransporter-associated beta strand protein